MKTDNNQNFYIIRFGNDVDSFNKGQSLLYSNDPNECYYVISEESNAKRLFIQMKDGKWYGGIPFNKEESISESLLLNVIRRLNKLWQQGKITAIRKQDKFPNFYLGEFFYEGGIVSPCDYVS